MTTQNDPRTPVESGYVPVNGLEMYYEIHGSGRPLVLLHGNLSAIGTSFGKVLPKLSSTRRIIAVEQQGHGHTADIDRRSVSSNGRRTPPLSALPPWCANSSGQGGPAIDATVSTPNC